MNILFDLDGTLTDPFEGITKSIAHALEKMGKSSPELIDLKWCIGPPLKKSLAELLGTDDDAMAQKALSFYRERFGSTGLYQNRVYAGIEKTLGALKKDGHHLYVATSKPGIYAEKITDYFKLTSYFTQIFGSELDGIRTDKGDLIAYIIEEERLSPDQTLMVGDRKHDIIGAHTNGIKAIGVRWGYGGRKELEDFHAEFLVAHPIELTDLIRELSDDPAQLK